MPPSPESSPDPATDDTRLDSGIDDLYRLPLSDFVSARDAWVKELRSAGDKASAKRVKGLSKPSVSAWVVNRLWWAHRQPFETMLLAGHDLREAQLQNDTATQSEATGRRRAALQELLGYAESILREAGNAAAASTMRRVTTTLEALAAHGLHPPPPGPGRLAADLDPPGFGLLAAPPSGPSPIELSGSPMHRPCDPTPAVPRPAEDELALERAKKTAASAARARRLAAAATDEAKHRLQRAQETAERAREVLQAAKRRAEETIQQRAEAEELLRTCQLAEDEAAQHVAAAEAELKRLEKPRGG